MPLDFEIEEFEGLDPAPPIDDKTTIDNGFDLPIDDKPTDDVIVNDGEPPVNTQSDDVEDPIYLSVLEKSGLEFTDEELATLKDDEEGIVTAAQLIADFLKITTDIKNGKGTLGMLIRDPELASSLKQTMLNLKTTHL